MQNNNSDYLEGAFLLRRLPPYHDNIRKRQVKSPKVYWRDSGLLHALLGISDQDTLLSQPWVGASWEGFVIEQILGAINAADQRLEPFFFADQRPVRVGPGAGTGGERWAIEVKLTANPGPGDISRLQKTAGLIAATRCYLISQTPKVIESEKTVSCNLEWFLARVVAG